MLSTSGSTGSSKFVRLSGGNLQANAESIAKYLGLGSSDRAITSLPPSYSYGLSVINSHLASGASVVLTEASVLDEEFRTLLTRHGVTGLAGVPSSYDLMDRAGLLATLPSTVRTLTQAGGRMSPTMVARVAAFAKAADARLFVMYGQTEATARIAYLPPELLADHPAFIGRAIPGGELWVESADGQRAPIGQEGELLYRGPNVMMGYALARGDLAAPSGPDVLRTGDLAKEAEPGLFQITGRKSRFVKPFGLRVGLDDLEQRCRDAGASVYVAGTDDLIVLAVELDADLLVARACAADLDLPEDLFEFLMLEGVPLLANGKVDYQNLLQQARQARTRQSSAPGIDGVRALFERLARGRNVDDADTFESLGGDSLNYVQCSILLEEAIGRLPPGWEKLTLPQIAALANEDEPKRRLRFAGLTWVESDVIARCGAITAVVLQHTLGGVRGGSDVLMMLAGFSWARFQRRRLIDGQSGAVMNDFFRRYLLVYIAIMFAVSLLNGDINWLHLAFVSTFFADWGGILNIYWFIECLAWCVGLTCLAFAFPSVRKVAGAAPIRSALYFVAVALSVRLIGEQVADAEKTAFRTPDQMLLYFAAGWAIALAAKPLRICLVLLLCGVSAFAWGWNTTHVALMASLGLLVALAPRIALPALVARAVMLVAAASFYIYLMNAAPMYLRSQVLRVPLGEHWASLFVLSMALGVGVHFVVEWVSKLSMGTPVAWLEKKLGVRGLVLAGRQSRTTQQQAAPPSPHP